MTLEEIKELIAVVQQSGVAELEVQRGENRVRIRRSAAQVPQEIVLSQAAPPVVTNSAAPAAITSAALLTNAAAAPIVPPTTAQPEPENETDLTFVKSPIVGTYYDAASPGAPPFVKPGDHVSPGQVLCIIESMKLMNEIESEISGVVIRKLVENGKPVEYGQALFAIRPS